MNKGISNIAQHYLDKTYSFDFDKLVNAPPYIVGSSKNHEHYHSYNLFIDIYHQTHLELAKVIVEVMEIFALKHRTALVLVKDWSLQKCRIEIEKTKDPILGSYDLIAYSSLEKIERMFNWIGQFSQS